MKMTGKVEKERKVSKIGGKLTLGGRSKGERNW
jgi:hypothetical protein